jgi:DNA-binding Lrp family transcriptional regulator
MAGYPQVLELHRLFGSPDYLVRVAVADLPAYEQFLTSKVLAIPGIHRVSSRFPMKTIKSLRPL